MVIFIEYFDGVFYLFSNFLDIELISLIEFEVICRNVR